jgi:sulfite oxidase
VYDITKFIPSHPGGSDKIVMAAGKSVEPFWRVYRQHYNSALPMSTLAPLRVGTLHPDDVASQDKARDTSDPYSADPEVSPVLTVHAAKPMNAEPPTTLLQHTWLTPNEIFFVRNHHPVPLVDEKIFRLEIDLGVPVPAMSSSGKTISLSLEELRSISNRHEVAASIQCGGNRRSEMNSVGVTAGTPW